jgi:type I site-specific restriction endonuclease
MKCAITKIEVEGSFTVTARELEVIHHIMSYDNKKEFIKGMVSGHYHGGVSAEEMEKVMNDLRDVTGVLINKNKQVALFKG